MRALPAPLPPENAVKKNHLVAFAFLLLGPLTAAQTPSAPVGIPAGQPVRPPADPKPVTDRLVTSSFALTGAAHVPGDTTRLFLVEQRGRIMILDLATNTILATPYLDIDTRVIGGGGERGLLGLAFHPNYATNGLFYVNYSRTGDGATIVAEYSVTLDPNVASFSSERILLTIAQPQSNHNGGWLGFSPLDGYLYIATGDGGGACDTGTGHTTGTGNSQDITANLLGKMLRIDPTGAVPYAVPPTNPFVGLTGDDEIWAYGLRNPWKASFDLLTGDLYIGDVGQDVSEEIDYQPAASPGGENYGWRCREGNSCSTSSPSSCPSTTGCTCPGSMPTLTAPVHAYLHTSPPAPTTFVCSVTGGHVYRGSVFPQLDGHYFLADYCGNAVWSFRVVGGVKTDFLDWTSRFSPSIDGFNVRNVLSFAEDASGELYILSATEVFKIVPKP
jgi:glucose/arabinose dehydrogenase